MANGGARVAPAGLYEVPGFDGGKFRLYDNGKGKARYWELVEVRIDLQYKAEFNWTVAGPSSAFYETGTGSEVKTGKPYPPRYLWFFFKPEYEGGGQQHSRVWRVKLTVTSPKRPDVDEFGIADYTDPDATDLDDLHRLLKEVRKKK